MTDIRWGILLLICVLPDLAMSGRMNHNPQMFMKRVGPFSHPHQQRQRQKIYNHPYMENTRIYESHSSSNRRNDEYDSHGSSWPQKLPEAQLSNRKLMMPIISEGYASTNIQGGRRNSNNEKEEKLDKEAKTSTTISNLTLEMKANLVEQAKVEEISTTSLPITPPSTTTVSEVETNHLESESSAYYPDIPDSVAKISTEDTSKIYDNSAETAEYELNSPFIIREDEYANPLPPKPIQSAPIPRPAPPPPSRPAPPPPPPSTASFSLASGTAEAVSPYGTDDSLTAPVITLEDVQTQTDEYVRLVATPPKQHINLVSPGRLPLSNVDSQGFFQPQASDYSDKYLAGYEQLDFPDPTSLFPGHINPELIDPDDYHQDRPSFKATQINGNTPQDYYPLGKPPKAPQVTPDILAKGQDSSFSFKPERPLLVEKKKNPDTNKGSFFDFLIPAFVRSSNKADPEGPLDRPRDVRPKVKLNKNRIDPRVPVNTGGLASIGAPKPPGPQGGPKPPPVPDFVPDLPHLKYPSRPVGTFPHPHEYGGRLNPILLRVGPNGNPLPGQNPLQPAPKAALKKIGLSKPDTEPNLVEDEPIFEDLKIKSPIVNLPPSPPLLRRPRPPNDAPLKMPSQPVLGLSRVRPQEPFQKKRPPKPPMPLNLPGIPQHPKHRYASSQNKKQTSLEEYRQKLQDPEFHQNLTKAHVYHAADLEHEVKDLDREDHQVPSLTQALLSYLQDANPFNFRPKTNNNSPKKQTIQTYNENMIEQNDVFPSQQKIESRLVAPTTTATTTTTRRPIKIIKIEKPEVVYNPKSTTVQTTTTTTTTTTSTTTSTTTYDPIADHVNLLLQQYFSTQTPDQEPNSVPMITYDDENNSVVMEYMSPDGEQDQAVVLQQHDEELDQQTEPALLYEKHFGSLQNSELPNQYALEVIPEEAEQQGAEDEMLAAESHQYQTFEAVPSGESQWPQVPNFFPQPENPDRLLLPQPIATFERVFEPSSKTDELKKTDWFVLDENGTRQLNLSIDEEPIAEQRTPTVERSGQVIENDGIDELEEDNTERNFVEGDFEPMMAPTQ